MRQKIQDALFKVGCFVNRHNLAVSLIGITILLGLCVGLKKVRFETNVEKLWVQGEVSKFFLLTSLTLRVNLSVCHCRNHDFCKWIQLITQYGTIWRGQHSLIIILKSTQSSSVSGIYGEKWIASLLAMAICIN